jgi:predicted transcriptional regulator
MKKTNPSFNKKQTPKKRLKIPPVHRLATFKPARKSIDPSRKFEVSLLDFFPPSNNLTANETKVLIVLRAFAVGSSNLAAIDQAEISIITAIQQPNVARAIAGLRKKGIIKHTEMEEGSQLYRNIYTLWSPPKQVEKDAKKMLSQKRVTEKLEKKAQKLENFSGGYSENLRKKIQQEQEKICPLCKGNAMNIVYLPSKNLERYRWCDCSLGIYQAKEHNCPWNEFVPDHIAKQYVK